MDPAATRPGTETGTGPGTGARTGPCIGSGIKTSPASGLADRLRRALKEPGGAPSSDFDLNPGLAPPAGHLRPAGVLIGVTPDQRLVLTRRSAQLKHHPGQIAFPGGKVDPGDDGPIGAALREAQEEVGLPARAAEVLGTLPAHRTVTGFAITPVVALLQDFDPRPEPGEVDEIFLVPMDHVLDPARYRVRSRHFNGVDRRYFVVPWGPYYIWGATARMLRVLAERVA